MIPAEPSHRSRRMRERFLEVRQPPIMTPGGPHVDSIAALYLWALNVCER